LCGDDENSDAVLQEEIDGLTSRAPVRHVVSREFRDYLEASFPGVQQNRAFWRMLGHLMFGTWCDHKTKQLIVGARMLAEFEDRMRDWESNNYCAKNFLRAFSDTVVPITWSGWKRDVACRTIECVSWPPGFEDELERESAGSACYVDRVLLDTGETFSEHRMRMQQEMLRSRALRLIGHAKCADARRLLEYLGQLPANRYSSLRSGLPEVVSRAKEIALARSRTQQLRVLRVIRDHPQPFMGPTSGSVRIYPLAEGILSLRSELRTQLLSSWHTADLKGAQLAICAAEWNVKIAQELLRDEPDPWAYFAGAVGMELTTSLKRALKRAVYGLTFGMLESRIRQGLMDGGIEAQAADRFVNDDVVRALLTARQKQFEDIEKFGGACDRYGRVIRLGHARYVNGKPVMEPRGSFTRRSILAQVAQSTELTLLAPVIDAAIESVGQLDRTAGLCVTVWVHDGFYFVPHVARCADSWKRRLKQNVDTQARKLGIVTELQV